MPKKVGRPKIKIDEKEVLKLAQLNCTFKEIAAFFDVSQSTISDNYRTIIEKGRESGKISIRKKQYDVAMGGNVTMLIWLGKQYLDQREPDPKINLGIDNEQLNALINEAKRLMTVNM